MWSIWNKPRSTFPKLTDQTVNLFYWTSRITSFIMLLTLPTTILSLSLSLSVSLRLPCELKPLPFYRLALLKVIVTLRVGLEIVQL